MYTADFDYTLPQERIAQAPLKERDRSKLLCLNRNNQELDHKIFADVIEFLEPGDCLVVNDSKVLPVRLRGKKEGGGAKIELLLLEELEKGVWKVLVQRSRRLKQGSKVVISPNLESEVLIDEGKGVMVMRFETSFPSVQAALIEFGEIPLPPYIKREEGQRQFDYKRYQTVYAEHNGSAAAPTAGFHFSLELLHAIRKKGIKQASVTLHVGLDTFRPISTERVVDHQIHKEYIQLQPKDAAIINETKKEGGKVVAVGTTSVRVLESCGQEEGGRVVPYSGKTDLYIYPGYQFKTVDAMITNFHLPETSLLVMIAAFIGGDYWRTAYNSALDNHYRFYSYGDAMFIY